VRSPFRLPRELLRRLGDFAPVESWMDRTQENLTQPAFQRDRDFLEKLLPLMELFNRYFDSEVRGFHNVPAQGPMLLVGNHPGGTLVPDTTALIATWYRERGLDSPLVGLAFDGMFGIPGVESLMRKIGEVPASHSNAARALEEGAAVLVYPGGAHEAFRPWTQRNRIDLDGHKGFIKLALRARAPVVPVVGHGAHQTLVVLSRGEWLAERLGLERMRVRIAPVIWQMPWGVSMPLLPGIPLPAKITVQICKPMDWSRYGPDDADDPKVLARCYRQITGRMQRALSRLAKERPYPVLSRLGSLLPGTGS
jgi:1-acyl-sn-glycerol-3-phosphate acyltransferase